METIDRLQREIIHEFSQFNGDLEKILFYIIEQGQHLPPMADTGKTDDCLIKGCHSKVWLRAVLDNGRVYFQADSNTAITRGLIFLLIRILNAQSPETIAAADLYFMEENRMDRFIGVQRSNGFAAIISRMKTCADQLSLYEHGLTLKSSIQPYA